MVMVIIMLVNQFIIIIAVMVMVMVIIVVMVMVMVIIVVMVTVTVTVMVLLRAPIWLSMMSPMRLPGVVKVPTIPTASKSAMRTSACGVNMSYARICGKEFTLNGV